MTSSDESRRQFGRPDPAGTSALVGYADDDGLIMDICRVVTSLADGAHQRSLAVWAWHIVARRLEAGVAGTLGVALAQASERLRERDSMLLACVLAHRDISMARAATLLFGPGRALHVIPGMQALARCGLIAETSHAGASVEAIQLVSTPPLSGFWSAGCRALLRSTGPANFLGAEQERIWRLIGAGDA